MFLFLKYKSTCLCFFSSNVAYSLFCSLLLFPSYPHSSLFCLIPVSVPKRPAVFLFKPKKLESSVLLPRGPPPPNCPTHAALSFQHRAQLLTQSSGPRATIWICTVFIDTFSQTTTVFLQMLFLFWSKTQTALCLSPSPTPCLYHHPTLLGLNNHLFLQLVFLSR